MKKARLFGLLAAVLPLLALDPQTKVSDFVHTAWKGGEYPFSGILSLAQTANGVLWLASFQGVYSFDGVRFTRFEPLSSSVVHRLFAARDGSLWALYSSGTAIARLFEGKVTTYAFRAGAITEANDGSIVVTLPRGLLRFRDGSWVESPAPPSLSKSVYTGLWPDMDGGLWLATGEKFYKRPFGSEEFIDAGIPVKPRYLAGILAQSADGTLWFAGADETRSVTHGEAGIKVKATANVLKSDRQGALWIGTNDVGLLRIPTPASFAGRTLVPSDIEQYSSAEGLSGDRVWSILEDREGNVWVGTGRGLDRFRPSAFRHVRVQTPGSIDELRPMSGGGILVRRRDQPVLQKLGANGEIIALALPKTPIAFNTITRDVTCVDTDGAVWLGTTGGIARLTQNGILYPRQPPLREISRLDCNDGDVWLHDRAAGVHRVADGKVVSVPGFPGRPTGFFVEARGKLWITHYEGTGTSYNNGVFREYGKQDGLAAGVPVSMFQTPAGELWLVSEHGLTRIKDGRFQSADVVPGVLLAYGSASNDAVWLRGGSTLIKIDQRELNRAIQEPGYRPPLTRFDTLDGIPSLLSIATVAGPRLWIVASDGLGYLALDKSVHQNSLPPPVQIESFTADGKQFAASPRTELPKRIHTLRIDYTAFSLTLPERVQFQYKLDGIDEDWQNAGPRRQAYYTDPPPRNYRFRVKACNNDGVWNEAGGVVEFSIAPAWFQTAWFYASCLLASMAVIWLLFRVRMRQVARTLTARFDERLAERTRLARELHDTLLQTIQGSKMVADDALDGPSDPARLRRAVEQLSIWLGQATQEGRAALNSLRSSTVEQNDLAEAFRRATEAGAVPPSMTATLSVSGEARKMHPIIRDEVYRIGYEAIRNACVHSGASRLEVELRYGKALVVRVSDNGVGIHQEVAQTGKEGHFGLQGMRERAARIGATLTLDSSQASGTTITLVVPGTIVFQKPPGTTLEKLRNAIRRFRKPRIDPHL